MATREFPNRNVNMPMKEGDVAAARARLAPPYLPNQMSVAPTDGKGSRRQVREGEWIDDRVIVQGGPSSPSADSPPEILKAAPLALPTFDTSKVYAVTLGKPCVFAGRMLSPAKTYQMTGETCLDPEVNVAIIDAVEVGDIPAEPDINPSAAKSSEAEAGESSIDAEATTTTKKRKG